jgi:hypothetical protein
MSFPSFPDLHHFEQIRQRLWCGREFGQAAVMVGSGFSRNAEKIAPSTPDFPLWSDLASDIYDELYPHTQGQTLTDEQRKANDKAKERALANPLALASEYEVTFGSPALQDLLIRSVPDNQYNPGKLHKLLMSLPWSDVFTTNYDTLLERTRPFIHDRKYDLICTTADIPGRMKPRIVKLHGSFPSHRPFIITEEDYRAYPRKFAPFVNMVQQSIMENVFCLIGFSGEDPNFLNWIGWVRDNLGESTPPIYLCGLLDSLSESKKQILRNKNIFTVDVAPLFPRSEWLNSSLRHARSIEWFLLSLMSGKPPNITNWPNLKNGNEWVKRNDLPELISNSKCLSRSTDLHKNVSKNSEIILADPNSFWNQNSGELSKESLMSLYKKWSEEHKKYPGWIVCPRQNREIVWHEIKSLIWQIAISIDNLPDPERIFMLYELNWRFEVTLTPLLGDWIEKITSSVSLYNPYPSIIELAGAKYSPSNLEFKKQEWNWLEIRRVWSELAFALARAYRENNNQEQFSIWIERMQKIASTEENYKPRFFYEKCLFHLSRLEHHNVKQTLNEWSSKKSVGIWEIRRASIFAELGELKEAEQIAEEALSEIRSRFQPYSIDYCLLSQEAWTMFLLKHIQLNFWDRNIDYQLLHQDRWQQLESYRCNVSIEFNNLLASIDRPPPLPKQYKERKTGFYPRTFSESFNLAEEPSWYESRPAFNILRTLEEGGSPLRCGMVVHSDAIFDAARWVSPHSEFLSLSSILRVADNNKNKTYFSFIRVATLKQEYIYYLFSSTLNFLNIRFYSQGILGDFQDAHTYSCLVILSRLCFRLPEFLLDSLLEFSIKTYRHIISQERLWGFSECINDLFESILYSLSDQKIYELISKFLEIPLIEDVNSNKNIDLRDPFSFIRILGKRKHQVELNQVDCASHIDELLLAARHGKAKRRENAIFRLAILYELNSLTDFQKAQFSEVLWARLDHKTQLPSETGLLNSALLNLPQPEIELAKDRLRLFFVEISFPEIFYTSEEFGQKFQATSGLDDRIFKEICNSALDLRYTDDNVNNFLEWNSEEVIALSNKLINWWTNEKNSIDSALDLPLAGNSIKKCLHHVNRIFSIIILPRLRNIEIDLDLRAVLQNMFVELDSKGFLKKTTLPSLLFNDFEDFSYDRIAKTIRTGLVSPNKEEVFESIHGVLNWILFSQTCNLACPPQDLFNELISRILARSLYGLDAAMDSIVVLLKKYPSMFEPAHIDSLILSLEYLLKETELPDAKDLEMAGEATYHERPEYRRLSSQLAHHLYSLLEKQGINIPEVLNNWKNISKTDILPEVRKVWQ